MLRGKGAGRRGRAAVCAGRAMASRDGMPYVQAGLHVMPRVQAGSKGAGISPL